MTGTRTPEAARTTVTHWRDRAACLGKAQLFDATHEPNPPIAEAKAVCARCPVITDCLDNAMSSDLSIPHGVRGGLDADERRNLKRRQANARKDTA